MALSQQLCPPSNLQASGEEPVYRLGWMDGRFIGLYLPACGVLRGTQIGWGRHTSVDGYPDPPAPPAKSASRQSLPRCRNSVASVTDDQPHIGNYRLLKTIGKGNFAKVKLARHILTGREVNLFYATSHL
ncbi:serine/threonine-protein kinase MARK1 [Tachysurus ichikawai]